LSSHAIPGNETSVTRVINSLYHAGAEVVHGGNTAVHLRSLLTDFLTESLLGGAHAALTP
jgi:mRNA degradation ribonuclease J1/J2